MGDRLLVYGATGYTGGLLAALAKERGLAPIVAGRSAAKVEAIAQRLGVQARVASVDDGPALREMFRDVGCVISSAGPFSKTARQMFEAYEAQLTRLGFTQDARGQWRRERTGIERLLG